jgi:CoA-transferase family III
MPEALDHLRVVDLTSSPNQRCARLFADLGAEVLMVEPPGGDPSRDQGPFFNDERGPDRSLSFTYLNRGKKSVSCRDGYINLAPFLPRHFTRLVQEVVKSESAELEDGRQPGDPNFLELHRTKLIGIWRDIGTLSRGAGAARGGGSVALRPNAA